MSQPKPPVTVEAYPLQWPVGWERTASEGQKEALYKVSFEHARAALFASVRKLGGDSIVISTNIPVRKTDGFPYASAREPADAGVAVYWVRRAKDGTWRNEVIACDKWRKVRGNLRAIGLAVEALRQLQRTGATDLLERAFQGFAQLPEEAGVVARSCWEVLDHPERTLDAVCGRFFVLAQSRHPDRGGTHQEMVELNWAFHQAKKELGCP